MINFLKQLQLSDEAIALYTKSLGKYPMTQYELNTITPTLNPEEFMNTLNSLVEAGLLIPINPKSPEILLHYFSIPPIAPILNYYANIDAGLLQIEEAVKNLMSTSLNQIFSEGSGAELDSLLEEYNELKSDINEDTLIQKQDVEDLIEEMEAVSAIKELFNKVHEKIKSITQTQFATLIKTLTKIKTLIHKQVDILDIKKGEEIKDAFKLVVENVFKEKLQQMIGDFTSNLYDLIEAEFKNLDAPIEKINVKLIHIRDDFKMLYLNAITGFEEKMNKVQHIIERNKSGIEANLDTIKNRVTEQMDSVIKDSLNQVSGLNKPVTQVMQQYLQDIGTPGKITIDHLWLIDNRTKINESISNIIANSKQQITLIVPKIEQHLRIEQLQNRPAGLQVRIIASDPHVNTTIQSLKAISGVSYKKLENDAIIFLQGDNSQLIMGIVKQDSQDPLNDIIGFGTNFPILIGLLSSIIETTWASATGDMGVPSPASAPAPVVQPKPIISQSTGPRPSAIASEQSQTTPQPWFESQPQPQLQPRPQAQPQYSAPAQVERPQLQPAPKAQPAQEIPSSMNLPSSSVQPKPGDQVGELISKAFDAFLQQVNTLKGPELSRALLDVTDLILEQKGYSVTLHSVRKSINDIKQKDRMLNPEEIQELFANVQEWKQRLFQ